MRKFFTVQRKGEVQGPNLKFARGCYRLRTLFAGKFKKKLDEHNY